MKNIIYVLMAVVCLNSCMSNQQKDNAVVQLPQENYIIPDTLYSFFQKYSNEKSKLIISVTNAGDTDLPYFAEEFVITYIVKGYSCQDTSWFTQMKKGLIDNGAYELKSGEERYFVIGSERDMLNSFDTLSLKERYANYLNTPLILNFHEIFKEKQDLYDKTTICGLPGDYEILIIKSGNEYVLPEKYRYDWKLLAEKLRHGYTSGIAYNKTDSSILYWVVTW